MHFALFIALMVAAQLGVYIGWRRDNDEPPPPSVF